MIPAQIVTDLASLQTSVAAARPLLKSLPLLKAALVTAGMNLTADIDTALAASVGALDADDPTGFAGGLVDDLIALSVSAYDQATLADMRGTVGRAVFNLAQI